MKRLDKKRALKLSSRMLTILTIVILVASLYNIVAFLSTIISGDSGNSFDVKMERSNSTGIWTLSLNANPRNNGVLPVNFYLEMSIYDMQDNLVATNSSSVYVDSGGSKPFGFTLTIPPSFAQGEELRGDEGYMQMRLSVRTLGDLVGLSQVMRVGGPSEAGEGAGEEEGVGGGA